MTIAKPFPNLMQLAQWCDLQQASSPLLDLSAQQLLYFSQHQGRHYQVCQTHWLRWLEIDGVTMSIMALERPANLLHPHCQLMARIIHSLQVDAVLEWGLGGGALNRYFAHHLPSLRWLSLENDAIVSLLAQQYFDISDQRFCLSEQLLPLNGSWPCLVHDTATNLGIGPAELTCEYWQTHIRYLADGGWLLINALPQTDQQFQLLKKALQQAAHQLDYACQLQQQPVLGYRNRIILMQLHPRQS